MRRPRPARSKAGPAAAFAKRTKVCALLCSPESGFPIRVRNTMGVATGNARFHLAPGTQLTAALLRRSDEAPVSRPPQTRDSGSTIFWTATMDAAAGNIAADSPGRRAPLRPPHQGRAHGSGHNRRSAESGESRASLQAADPAITARIRGAAAHRLRPWLAPDNITPSAGSRPSRDRRTLRSKVPSIRAADLPKDRKKGPRRRGPLYPAPGLRSAKSRFATSGTPAWALVEARPRRRCTRGLRRPALRTRLRSLSLRLPEQQPPCPFHRERLLNGHKLRRRAFRQRPRSLP